MPLASHHALWQPFPHAVHFYPFAYERLCRWQRAHILLQKHNNKQKKTAYYEFALCCKQRLDAFKDTCHVIQGSFEIQMHATKHVRHICGSQPYSDCWNGNQQFSHVLVPFLCINKGKLSSSSFNLQQPSNVVTAAALASGEFLLTMPPKRPEPCRKETWAQPCPHSDVTIVYGETWRHDHQWNWRQIKFPLQKTCAELQLHHYLRVNPCWRWRAPDQWRSGPVEMKLMHS